MDNENQGQNDLSSWLLFKVSKSRVNISTKKKIKKKKKPYQPTIELDTFLSNKECSEATNITPKVKMITIPVVRLNQLEEENKKLTLENEILKKDNNNTLEELSQLKASFNKLLAEKESLEKKRVLLEQSIVSEKEKIISLEKNLHKLKKTITNLEKTNNDLTKRFTVINNENKKFTKVKKDLSIDIDRLKSKVVSLTQKLEKKDALIEKLQEEVIRNQEKQRMWANAALDIANTFSQRFSLPIEEVYARFNLPTED